MPNKYCSQQLEKLIVYSFSGLALIAYLGKFSKFTMSFILECNTMADNTQARIMCNPESVVFYETFYAVH